MVDSFLNEYLTKYVFDTDWESIKSKIMQTDFAKIASKKDSFVIRRIEPFVNMLYEQGLVVEDVKGEDIIKLIEDLFDPSTNGFESVIYNSEFSEKILNIQKKFQTIDLQLWCEGPVLMKKLIKV